MVAGSSPAAPTIQITNTHHYIPPWSVALICGLYPVNLVFHLLRLHFEEAGQCFTLITALYLNQPRVSYTRLARRSETQGDLNQMQKTRSVVSRILVSFLLGTVLTAQVTRNHDVALKNWPAPLYWQPSPARE